MKYDADSVIREIDRLKNVAEKFPILNPDSGKMPHKRHWSNLPGKVRACFTKKLIDGTFYYHLSVSSAKRPLVPDDIALRLLNALDAPGYVSEIPAGFNQSVRHFMWTVNNYN